MEKKLLNFIPEGKDWIGCSAAGMKSYEIAEDEEKKLELRLGPPSSEDCSVDPVNCVGNPHKVAKCANIGAKLGFLTSECKTEAFQQQQQQLCGFVQHQSLERKKMSGFGADAGAREIDKGKKSLQASAPASHASPVVGWPPVRSSFRKNIASSSKTPVETRKESLEVTTKVQETKKNLLVKINMEGIPIGRKVDLKAYDSYDKLTLAVDDLFRCLLAAQTVPVATGSQKGEDKRTVAGLLDSGEYTLVYEDDEGDRMLVGDVPWNMFVSTARRLRVLKSSELSSSTLGTASRKRTANEC